MPIKRNLIGIFFSPFYIKNSASFVFNSQLIVFEKYRLVLGNNQNYRLL